MDTNLVLPLGHEKCEVIYDYYLEDEKFKTMTSEQVQQFISSSLKDSNQVRLSFLLSSDNGPLNP